MKKTHKKIPKTFSTNRYLLRFGSYGFKILSSICLKKEQIVAIERSLFKKLKSLSTCSKNCKSWTLFKTDRTLTKLNLESRMGKGKGAISTEIVFLKKGTVIYEFENLKIQHLKEIYKLIKHQLSVDLLLITKK